MVWHINQHVEVHHVDALVGIKRDNVRDIDQRNITTGLTQNNARPR